MAFTSLAVVLISTLTFVLGTFPEFQPEEESGQPEIYPEAVAVMEIIDNIAVGFFLIEYVVRFVVRLASNRTAAKYQTYVSKDTVTGAVRPLGWVAAASMTSSRSTSRPA